MKKVSLALASVSALAATAAPASAALIEKNIKVTSNFTYGLNASLSYDFDIRFDNASDISATSDGLTVYNSPFGLKLMYQYSVFRDRLTIGSYAANGRIGFDHDDTVAVAVDGLTRGGANTGFSYYTLNSTRYTTNRNSIVVSSINSAVPEPSTWMMLVLGFGVIGYAMRRKTVLRYV